LSKLFLSLKGESRHFLFSEGRRGEKKKKRVAVKGKRRKKKLSFCGAKRVQLFFSEERKKKHSGRPGGSSAVSLRCVSERKLFP